MVADRPTKGTDRRTVRKFLLFPLRLPVAGTGRKETRWLGTHEIVQIAEPNFEAFGVSIFLTHFTWRDYEFVR
jgi:hypothetical protein